MEDQKLCPVCGTSVSSRRKDSIYCSIACRKSAIRERKQAGIVSDRTTKIRCANCGETFSKKSSNHRFCSNSCSLAWNKAESGGGAYKIFLRDSFRCFYCGRSAVLHSVSLHLDHVHPASKGGETKAYNLATSCQKCNVEKGDNVLDEKTKREILEEIDRRNEHSGIPQNFKVKMRGREA